MDKLIINCTTGEIEEVTFTPEELSQQSAEQQLAEEQALLDSLIPSQIEIDQAEFELKAINLLMEVGLL
ncbi:hypothetical protein [Desulfosporosinus fructosivorans]